MNHREECDLFDDIERKVRGLVDEHPLTRRLSNVARRNMAYSAGHAAIGAVTAEEWAEGDAK